MDTDEHGLMSCRRALKGEYFPKTQAELMRYKAVIFDLVGTLVDTRSDEFFVALGQEASILGLDPLNMRQTSTATRLERMIGRFGITRAQELLHFCKLLGIEAPPERIDAAVAIHHEHWRSVLTPRPGVLATLGQLADRGMPRGLISNCSAGIVEMWETCPLIPHFDTAVLSAAIGLAKPDPRIFQLACERLGITPTDTLYVGDGGDGELQAARLVGMDPVLLKTPYEDAIAYGDRPDPTTWDGLMISSIPEVMDLLG